MSAPLTARAFWTVAAGRGELRDEALPVPRDGQVLVRALASGVSRGTEALVFHGRVPASLHAAMRAPHQGGAFPFPVKYGYAVVGEVEAGPAALVGRRVFCLHPHQDRFVVEAGQVVPLPDALSTPRAVLAANVETALNAAWDAPILPAARVAVIGAGTVGLAAALLASRVPGVALTVIEASAARRGLVASLGLAAAAPGALAEAACDLVVHASASADGLAEALRVAGVEATIVELSWYGAGQVAAPLGEAFHARRLRLVASQVGEVAPAMRSRWPHAARLRAALDLLADEPRADALLGAPIAFAELPARAPELFGAAGAGAPTPLLVY